MVLEMHYNDNAREARPGLWIFQGRSVVLLVVGVATFVALFRTLDSAGLDLPINAAISLLPSVVMGAYVQFFVNGKPPSYAFDKLLFLIWRAKSCLYMAGWLDRPPALWIVTRKPMHPEEL
jgi:hypothetical protein